MNGSNSHRDRYAVYLYAYPISASLLGQYSTLTLMLNTSNAFFFKTLQQRGYRSKVMLMAGTLASLSHSWYYPRAETKHLPRTVTVSAFYMSRVIWVQPHGSPLVASYMLSWHCASSRDRSDIDWLLVDELTTHTVFCVTINVRLID